MKKIFISLPMRGRTLEEIAIEREKLFELAGRYFNEPVKLVENYLSMVLNPLECLGENLKRMALADYVLFSNGYEGARGCKIEMACALEYDKQILLEEAGKIEEI